MAYTTTGEGDSVVYLGVKVYFEENTSGKELHLTVFDREERYPYHIVRYPEFGTVAPQQQLGGVVMGRLVHCQETCSHMKDFKESVATIFRTSMWRGYPRRLVQSVWSRFLFQRWHSTDIRVKELRAWFSKVWAYLAKSGGKQRPDPTKPVPPLHAHRKDRAFLQTFGVSSTTSHIPAPQTAAAPAACFTSPHCPNTSKPSDGSSSSTYVLPHLQQKQKSPSLPIPRHIAMKRPAAAQNDDDSHDL